MSEETCILCEAQGLDNEAICKAEFNGDLIPVCEMHNELLKKDNILNILDEQSGQ